MAASVAEMETKPFSVLFVCLGNICRSPAAEGVFTDFVKKRGLDSHFKIDSAGTMNYHEVGTPLFGYSETIWEKIACNGKSHVNCIQVLMIF